LGCQKAVKQFAARKPLRAIIYTLNYENMSIFIYMQYKFRFWYEAQTTEKARLGESRFSITLAKCRFICHCWIIHSYRGFTIDWPSQSCCLYAYNFEIMFDWEWKL